MTCFMCKGNMRKDTTTYMTECNGCYIIIKNVPCTKCLQCGEEYLNGTTMLKIESKNNGIETVKVYFEKPVYGGFHSAECYLPSCDWKNIDGFSDEEIGKLQEFLQSVSHIIIRLAMEGGPLFWKSNMKNLPLNT